MFEATVNVISALFKGVVHILSSFIHPHVKERIWRMFTLLLLSIEVMTIGASDRPVII